jgi:hypothetical protein
VTPSVAITVEDGSAEALRAAVVSCESVLGAGACVSSGQVETEFEARIVPDPEGAPRLRIRWVTRREEEPSERVMEFSAADDEADRFVSAGLVIAGEVRSRETERRAAPPPRPPEPPVPIQAPEPEPRDPFAYGLDALGQVGPGLSRVADGGQVSPRVGGALRGWLTYGWTVAALEVRASLAQGTPEATWSSAALALGLRLPLRPILEGTAGFVAERVAVAARAQGTTDQDAGFRFGGRGAVFVGWPVSRRFAVLGTGDLTWLNRELKITVLREYVGRDPELRWLCGLGLRFRLD